jgi:hypothetical protein
MHDFQWLLSRFDQAAMVILRTFRVDWIGPTLLDVVASTSKKVTSQVPGPRDASLASIDEVNSRVQKLR